MQLIDFKIVDSMALEKDSYYFDLHSNYDFVGLSYNVVNQQVVLEWKKSTENWAKNERYQNLKLIFDSVSLFCISPRDDEKPLSEDNCLSHIGYLHPDDMELMEGFLPADQSGDNYHLVIGFESNLVVKVYSKLVKLAVS